MTRITARDVHLAEIKYCRHGNDERFCLTCSDKRDRSRDISLVIWGWVFWIGLIITCVLIGGLCLALELAAL